MPDEAAANEVRSHQQVVMGQEHYAAFFEDDGKCFLRRPTEEKSESSGEKEKVKTCPDACQLLFPTISIVSCAAFLFTCPSGDILFRHVLRWSMHIPLRTMEDILQGWSEREAELLLPADSPEQLLLPASSVPLASAFVLSNSYEEIELERLIEAESLPYSTSMSEQFVPVVNVNHPCITPLDSYALPEGLVRTEHFLEALLFGEGEEAPLPLVDHAQARWPTSVVPPHLPLRAHIGAMPTIGCGLKYQRTRRRTAKKAMKIEQQNRVARRKRRSG
ncbi:hypothetical protein QOT17_003668 [Balamuthia mandrillaris]